MALTNNAVLKTVGLLGLGVAAGVALHKYWPAISGKVKPLLDSGAAKGAGIFSKGQAVVTERSEKIADIIAELKAEQASETVGAAEKSPNKKK